MVRSEKREGGYKNGCISEATGLIELKLGQNIPKGVFYLKVVDGATMSVLVPQHHYSTHAFWGCILGVRGVRQHRKILPFVPYVFQWPPVVYMNVHSYSQFIPPL